MSQAHVPVEVPHGPILGNLKDRYFSTRVDAIATTVCAALALWLLWKPADRAFVTAVFGAGNRAACLEAEGACWSVIAARWRIVLFGLYPFEEQWRSALACTVMAIVAALSCVPWFWSARRSPRVR